MDHVLGTRKLPYEVPSYSLTGDVISYARCGLQYRHSVLGRLPSTRPVQLWFGQFIHGVLEEAFRHYRETLLTNPKATVTFTDDECDQFIATVLNRLMLQGLTSHSKDAREQGERRARIALIDLAPLMFPLITHAEVKLTGTRDLPTAKIRPEDQIRGVTKYEMVGVVDVITELDPTNEEFASNLLIDLMDEVLGLLTGPSTEVIVDYKGMRRPGLAGKKAKNGYRELYERQIQTYSYLRQAQANGGYVVGGVLIFINELSPSWNDVADLYDEIKGGHADVVPVEGSRDHDVIFNHRSLRRKFDYPNLSLEFRLRRALLLVKVDPKSVDVEVAKFDDLVAEIEASRGREIRTGDINQSWEADDSDQTMCTACDFRVTCPKDSAKNPGLPK